MTDKQIIIDGVDVSGCEFAPKEMGWCNNGNLSSYCKDNPNCYYKQLKLKEQECEELKKKKEENTTFYLKKYANKDSECLELQHKVNVLSKTLTEIKEIAKKAKKDICNNCGWRNTDSCDAEDYTCGEFIKILQKITECEVVDET